MTVSGRCLRNGCPSDGIKQQLELRHYTRMRGFTLIELVVVIVIIGILTLIAVPNMREWAREGQIQSKSAEVRNLFELTRSKTVSSSKPGYIVGSNNLSIGLDNKNVSLTASVNQSPRVVFSFIDINQNREFNPGVDEVVGLVDMDEVQSNLPSVWGVNPNGLSGSLDNGQNSWTTTIIADDFRFSVSLQTGGGDFFNYDFLVTSAGQITETRIRDKNNHCQKAPTP